MIVSKRIIESIMENPKNWKLQNGYLYFLCVFCGQWHHYLEIGKKH